MYTNVNDIRHRVYYIILKVHTIENSNLLSEIPELSQIRKSIAFDSKLH